MKKSINNHSFGFTLIELLVVISIIGVLSALLLSNMQDARGRARDTQRKSDLKQIQKALEMYKQDNNQYPESADLVSALESGGQMKEVPVDPLSPNQDYVYTKVDQYEYTLVACLENASDSSADEVKDANCTNASFTLTEP